MQHPEPLNKRARRLFHRYTAGGLTPILVVVATFAIIILGGALWVLLVLFTG